MVSCVHLLLLLLQLVMVSCSVHWVDEQGWAEAESFIHCMQDLQPSGITGIVRPCTGVWCVTDVLTAVPHDH
jgi:hypothetical protein